MGGIRLQELFKGFHFWGTDIQNLWQKTDEHWQKTREETFCTWSTPVEYISKWENIKI